MKKRNIYLSLLSSAIIITSCSKIDEFLAEAPSKTSAVEIKTIDQLDQLLNGYQRNSTANPSAFFSEEPNTGIINSTDDFYLGKDLYDASIGGTFNIRNIQYALWDISYLPKSLTNTTDGLWSGEYRKIFYANTVLDYLDKVTGGTPEQKANLKAEAHLVRAYSYWILANTYCLPYTEATRNEDGLPIKLTITFEENPVRKPLHVVYEQIESDLFEALKIKNTLLQNGKARNWRASTAGVNGFAARYWLNRFDYVKALKYAEDALAEYSTLVDYNTQMRFGISQTLTLDAGTAKQVAFTIQYPYTHDNRDDYTNILGWKEFLYFRVLSYGSWWYIPSPDLLALYDQKNDLRYKYHIVEGYSYDRGLIKPSYNYPGYIFFYKDRIPSGPTVAEMLLIKAEALAHTGDPVSAMEPLNILRSKRMLPGSWSNLTASSKEEAIKQVADERRREMPFVQRWFDLRRYNNNEYSGDDITLTRSFYPYTISIVEKDKGMKNYTLAKGSRRWAVPIPITDIEASRGVIKQNTY